MGAPLHKQFFVGSDLCVGPVFQTNYAYLDTYWAALARYADALAEIMPHPHLINVA
jgi:hypothetical protein